VRVPRASQELALRVPVVAHEVSQQLGSRTATYADLADQLSGSVDDVAEVGAWRNYHLQSLNQPATATGSDDFIDVIGGIDPGYVRVEARLSLQPFPAEPLCAQGAASPMRFHVRMNHSQIGCRGRPVPTRVPRVLMQTCPAPGRHAGLTSGRPGAPARRLDHGPPRTCLHAGGWPAPS